MASFDKIVSAFEKADFAFTVVSVAVSIASLVGVYLNYQHTKKLVAHMDEQCAFVRAERELEKISR